MRFANCYGITWSRKASSSKNRVGDKEPPYLETLRVNLEFFIKKLVIGWPFFIKN
ncbi:hypothetical protein MARSALSMR5_04314 (plasmid) [Marinobacter salarius]|uniref:Uncharacterized protein n=1 Tax=Marinobacter salarius TaxID=1420917 RepID=A0A1W6KG00_9GAMM|nr:hypothetical protein MARSALSMR5_04314 [Marinobacter salarius]